MEKPDYLRSLGIRCLRWVLYAKRPLYILELQYALATLDEGQNAKDFELDDLDVIFGACANLVERANLVVEQTGGIQFIVRPIHYSIQEYFASEDQAQHLPAVKLPIGNRTDSNASLVADCLAHFYQPMMFSGQFEPINHPGCRLIQDPFLQYAANFFDKHLLATDPEVFRSRIDKLLESDPELFRSIVSTRAVDPHVWVAREHDHPSSTCRRYWDDYACAIETWTASSFVAATDLIRVLEIEGDYHCQEGVNTALLFACIDKSPGDIDQLLYYGADIECRDHHGRTPLHIAANSAMTSSNRERALFLVEKGADVAALDNEGQGVPWRWALLKGTAFLRRLFQRGADVNYNNYLSHAVLMGDTEIVRCLVEAGADVNATGGSFGLALHAASSEANFEMTMYLLDNGADINMEQGKNGTPLLATLRDGRRPAYNTTFHLLLNRGARLDVEAILIAARSLRVSELARILLELGDGPRYSAVDINDALVAVRKGGNRRRNGRYKERKRDIIRLLEMRLSHSEDGRKLAVGPEIRALTTSIYETECLWTCSIEWGSNYEWYDDYDSDSDSDNTHNSDSDYGSDGDQRDSKRARWRRGVLKQKQGCPVPGRHRARRVFVWFITRGYRVGDCEVTTRMILHEHG